MQRSTTPREAAATAWCSHHQHNRHENGPDMSLTTQDNANPLATGINALDGGRSAVVRFAADQAAMQPWIEMECYQLGRGNTLAKMDCLDLGTQQYKSWA